MKITGSRIKTLQHSTEIKDMKVDLKKKPTFLDETKIPPQLERKQSPKKH